MSAGRFFRLRYVNSIACVASVIRCVVVLSLPAAALAQAPGDVDCDGIIDAIDVQVVLHSLFGDSPVCATSDVNGDGSRSAADLTTIAQIIAAPAPAGPRITYFGLAGASGIPIGEFGFVGAIPMFLRTAGSGFKIVVEAVPGANGLLPGRTTARLDDPTQPPDLQIGCNRPLGDGSLVVCSGGVPALLPPHFVMRADTTRILNDFGCLFESFTASAASCTIDSFGNTRFVDAATRLQLCVQLSRDREFPSGDTLCSVRLRDVAGNSGPLASFLIRVGGEPSPPTFTPTPLPTMTPTQTHAIAATSTATRSATRSATFTRSPTSIAPTPTPTTPHTATPTRIPTGPPATTAAATSAPTTSFTATRTATTSATAVASPTRTPTGTLVSTATPTRTASRTSTATATRIPTATPTSTATRTFTHTRTMTRTPTASVTSTITPTATRTRTPTSTPSATPTGLRGPIVSFFGIARPDESLVAASGTTPSGIPIYVRPFATGFRIVVEGRAGASGRTPGNAAYQFGAPVFPDLQILSSRPLGNGSAAVCDRTGPGAGGVPAIDPPNFTDAAATIAATNDLGCRFLDGGGSPFGRFGTDNSCVQVPPNSGIFRFVSPTSVIQFCGLVDSAFGFPPGDTILTVRLRDDLGNVGETSRIVVRIDDAS